MKNPDKIEILNRYYDRLVEISALDEELRPLATNNDVERVITGDQIGVRLDKEALSSLIRLKE